MRQRWEPAGSGVFGSNGDYRYFPDLAVNQCGDMALGYTRSNSSSFPAVYVTGRLSGDLPAPFRLKRRSRPAKSPTPAFDGNPHRWGDYTAMTIDPDGSTFWYLGEYSGITNNANGRWATWINSFSYDTCAGDPGFVVQATPETAAVCTTGSALFDVNVIAVGGFTAPVTLSASGQPAGASVGFSSNPVVPTGSSVLTIGSLTGATPGAYGVTVQGVGGTPTFTATDTVALTLYAAQPAGITLLAPPDGQAGAAAAPTLSWSPAANAVSYAVDVATDAGFSNVVATASGLSATSYAPPGLAPNTIYYWRVSAANPCGGTVSATWAFLTEAEGETIVCATPGLAIPDGNPAGAFSELSVPSGGAITDLDVMVDISHTWVGDVAVVLRNNATATTVTLIDRPGVPASIFGCSASNIDVTVNDEGVDTAIENQCNAPPAIRGDAPGTELLSAFDGEALATTWRLTVTDSVTPDPGTLNEWCLVATNAAAAPPADFSDLNSSYGVAWHEGGGAYRLGSAWTDGLLFSDGVDNADDDGVGINTATWFAGDPATINVTVTGPAGGAYLAGWFDWNGDGDFADAGEQNVAQTVNAAPGGQLNAVIITVSTRLRPGPGAGPARPLPTL